MSKWIPFDTWTTLRQPVMVICPYCMAQIPQGECATLHVQYHMANDRDPPIPPEAPAEPAKKKRQYKKRKKGKRGKYSKRKKKKTNGS